MVEANQACEPALKLVGAQYDIVALSNEEKLSNFYVEKQNPAGTGASFYKELTDWYAEGKYNVFEIETKTLDSRNYFEGEKIDLIKIDVQGSEFDIISGGEKTLERTEYVMMEISLIDYNENSPKRRTVIEKMLELNFAMVDFLEYGYFKNGENCEIFQIDMLFKKIKK